MAPSHQQQPSHLRSRPIAAGQLRAFEAVARHLNFRAASEELSLTQSAVSRQIQSLESDVGVSLFLRHTRAVELTGAGAQLLRAVMPSLERIDGAVRLIRQSAGRKSVAISTWASFASMWLIPRLEAFQQDHPDIDIRIDATDTPVDLDTTDVDLALRYALAGQVPAHAEQLFGEQLTPVVSPWLLKSSSGLHKAEDLTQFPMVEATDAHRNQHTEWQSWQRWFDTHRLARFEPRRWLYFTYAHQIAQAALTGQGVALVRTPLVAESLASGAGRAISAVAPGLAAGLLADRGAAQHGTAGSASILRLAQGPGRSDARGNRRGAHRPAGRCLSMKSVFLAYLPQIFSY